MPNQFFFRKLNSEALWSLFKRRTDCSAPFSLCGYCGTFPSLLLASPFISPLYQRTALELALSPAIPPSPPFLTFNHSAFCFPFSLN